MMMEKPRSFSHAPVLVEEVISAFRFDHPAVIVDGTLGLGGHAEALLERYTQVSVVGVEWDAQALTQAEERLRRFGLRFRAIHGSYAALPALFASQGLRAIDGILLDLGVSSLQLDDASRGFSFRAAAPLDMRMSRDLRQTAWDVICSYDEEQLASVLFSLGEERHARRIAAALKNALLKNQLTNDTTRVADVIRRAIPGASGRINPATRSFQALRMEVNRELENVKTLLSDAEKLLKSGGRLAVIAFHSLEDRLVKQAFAAAAKGCVCPPQAPQCVCGRKPWGRLLSRKAVQPSEAEVAANPRARSARLRILEKL